MPMELKCESCGLGLGEVNKGRVRRGAVLLCLDCWPKAKSAMDIVRTSSESMPGFMKDVFDKGKFGR